MQARCQHHIHRLDTATGKRFIPNACRSKTKPGACKHEAPWTDRVSPRWMREPLLICQGLAKQFKLRCSGARNWLGQILGLRNNEWVNGTMPGLTLAFAGSNTDVKPNDRLPITATTHELHCKKNCVRKHSLKQSTRRIQRVQSVTNGYFGGYVGKQQPRGALETRKCIDKLFTLRSKMAGTGRSKQLRAASGRMITDVEMASTYRGAVEVFNLCRHLNSRDVLFAECVRTFDSTVLEGRSWGDSLGVSGVVVCCHVVCGLEFPWEFLCAYEFHMAWRAEPLLVPTYYTDRQE